MDINIKLLANELTNNTGLPERFDKTKKELLDFFEYDNINKIWNVDTDKVKSIGEIRKDISPLIDSDHMNNILYDLNNLGIHPLSYFINSILIK
jgi:hypothetical protein